MCRVGKRKRTHHQRTTINDAPTHKTLELNLPGRGKRRAAAGRRAPTDRKLRVEVVRHQHVAGKIAVGRHQRLLVAVMLNQHAQLFHPRLKFGL